MIQTFIRGAACVLVLAGPLSACATPDGAVRLPPAVPEAEVASIVAPMATSHFPPTGILLQVPVGGEIYREREAPVPGAVLGGPFAAGPAFGPLKPLSAGAPLRRAVIDGDTLYCAERQAYGGAAPIAALACFSDADGDSAFERVTGVMQPVEGGPSRYGPIPLAAPIRYAIAPYALSADPHAISLVYRGLTGRTLRISQQIEGPLPDASLAEIELTYDLPETLPVVLTAQPLTLRETQVEARPLVWRPQPLLLRVIDVTPAMLTAVVERGYHAWRLDVVARAGRQALVIDYQGEPEIERARRQAAAFMLQGATPAPAPEAQSPAPPVP